MDGSLPLVEDRVSAEGRRKPAPELPAGNGLFSLIGPELQAVERHLRSVHGDASGLLATVATYGLASGGKRIRPALVLLGARACGGGGDERSIRLASAAEMMHAATLIHDDIVDRSLTRRGLPSAVARWGSQVSVLVGDFLYARAIQTVVDDSDVRIMRAFADATVAMTEAEVLQLQLLHDLTLGEADYLRIVTGKTAALISASCRVGGLIAGAADRQMEALAAYGLNLGIGFQLVDDALDYVAREERLGKPVGSDFREGKITYPIMHLVRTAAPEDRRRLELLGEGGSADNGERAALFDLVERYHAVAATMRLVDEYLARARTQLEWLPDSPARRVLHHLVEFVRTRDR